jgi:O-antigen/teichoic acid export membrane protein
VAWPADSARDAPRGGDEAWDRASVRQTHRDIAGTIATRVAILGTAFLANMVTARALGVDGRGAYFLALTTALTVAQFGNLGMHSSTLYQLATDPSQSERLVVNSAWLGLGVGSLLGASCYAFLPYLVPALAARDGLGAASMALVPMQLMYTLAMSLLIGKHWITLYNACELGQRLLALAGFLVLIALGAAGPTIFLVVTVAAQASVTAAALWRLWPRRCERRFDRVLFRQGLRYGLRAYLACLLPFFIIRGSVFMLERVQGLSAIGQLSISLQLFDMLLIVPSTVGIVIFPRLVQAGDDRWPQTVRWLRAVALIMALGCGLVALVGEPVITLCFGAQFSPAAKLLAWLLPGAICLGGITICSQYLAAEGKPWALVAAWLGALVLFMVTAAVLIPRFGGAGAAVALSVTYAALFPVILQISRVRARKSRLTSVRAPAVVL